MDGWTFFDYVNARGDNEIHLWLNSDAVPIGAKAKINARLITLQGFPIFPEQYFSAYKGWNDLYELRIVFGNVQYRPFGFYGPVRRQFCLLACGVEKGSVPKSLLSIAEERRKLVITDTSRAVPHNFS